MSPENLIIVLSKRSFQTKEEYIRLMKIKDYEDHEEKQRSEYKKCINALIRS
jgi:hypothetical protein